MGQATKKIVEQLNSGATTELEFGRTKWRLLERSGNRVLLLSENLVDHAPFDRASGAEYVSWEHSHLRKHMSRDLPIILFSDAEYACVDTTVTEPTTNPMYRMTDNGALDKLFPLSVEEVDRYLGDGNTLNRLRAGSVTRSSGWNDVIGDSCSGNRIARLPGTNVDWWWLRTPGEKMDTRGFSEWIQGRVQYNQCYVGNKGSISMHGSNYDDGWGGIRPAMWLSL